MQNPDYSLNHVLSVISDYLSKKLSKKLDEDVSVELASVDKETGVKGKGVVLTLLRIEEETSRKPQNVYTVSKDRMTSPDLYINLEIMISSYSSVYKTALKILSNVLHIMNSIQTDSKPDSFSDGDYAILKSLAISLQTISFDQNLSLWQTLGVTLMPAAFYKIRMLTVQGEASDEPVSSVEKVYLKSEGDYLELPSGEEGGPMSETVMFTKNQDGDLFSERIPDE